MAIQQVVNVDSVLVLLNCDSNVVFFLIIIFVFDITRFVTFHFLIN